MASEIADDVGDSRVLATAAAWNAECTPGAPMTELQRIRQTHALACDKGKSTLASAGLSFFLGPIGWFYAAPLREAAGGTLVTVVTVSLLPQFLLAPVIGVIGPLSAAAGAYYAWTHNRNGKRTPLFG